MKEKPKARFPEKASTFTSDDGDGLISGPLLYRGDEWGMYIGSEVYKALITRGINRVICRPTCARPFLIELRATAAWQSRQLSTRLRSHFHNRSDCSPHSERMQCSDPAGREIEFLSLSLSHQRDVVCPFVRPSVCPWGQTRHRQPRGKRKGCS